MNNRETGISFHNEVKNIEGFNIFKYRNFYNGGGVAIGDINNDGLADVYLTANMGSNKLYLNKGNWEFEDITSTAGVAVADKWSTGVSLVDINADGYLDIYVCNAGYIKGVDQKNQLFINNGDLTFTEQAADYGLDDGGYTTHSAFFDYDQDGDLDVYILNNSFIPSNTLNFNNRRELAAEEWPVKDFLKGGGDKFLRNDNGIFVDVSKEVGIYQSLIGFGLGVTVGDFNSDGWDDIYVSNDFYEKDYLYINKRGAGFSEELEQHFDHISHSSMGADIGDVNNDGRFDLFVTDMLPDDEYRLKTIGGFDDINLRRLKKEKGFYDQYMHNTLQVNTGDYFKEIAYSANVAASDWSWGALMFDANNDRMTDLLVCNGIYQDVIDRDFMDFFANDVLKDMARQGKKEKLDDVIKLMPSNPVKNKFFRNNGNFQFEDVSDEWGLGKKTFSNGAAYGDLDNDGDYDLVINNVNQDALIYQNRTTNSGLRIQLKGSEKNRFGVGTKIFAHSEGNTQSINVLPSRGFQSSVDYTAIIGLGNDKTMPDSIVVIWPDQKRQKLTEYNDSLLIVNHADAQVGTGKLREFNKKLFVTEPVNSIKTHQEDEYVDFYHERGLYRKLSKEGPAVAYDENSGLLFIGGAKDQAGIVYKVTNSGSRFQVKEMQSLDSKYEDTAAELVDIDNDGDLDLVVGSGGNHLPPNHQLMRDRIYVNMGNNRFSNEPMMPVSEGMNTAVIASIDYDQDGDKDLFIGSRSVPKHFGYSALHYLLENDGTGKFKDRIMQVNTTLSKLRTIKDAIVVDLDGDGNEELITISDWSRPHIFRFSNKKAELLSSSLDSLYGWYNKVSYGDFNEDGIIDLVFGNVGSNFYLDASVSDTLKLWINDFDGNKAVDKILTYQIDGKDYPVALKGDLFDQLIFLKKTNLKHSDYASKTIQDLLSTEVLDNATKLITTEMRSYVAMGKENGDYDIIFLPSEAQFSSIHAILPHDIDSDGDLDLIIGGNDLNFIPQFSQLDALHGGVIINSGDGQWQYMPDGMTGLNITGETKAIISHNSDLIFIRNNDSAILAKKL